MGIFTVDIIILDQSSSFSEYINASLVPVIDFIFPDSRIAVRCDPHAGEIIRMDAVLEKLTEAIFMNVYATSLTVMNFAFRHCRICASFHFETGDTIIMDVVQVKITLANTKNRQIILPINTQQ